MVTKNAFTLDGKYPFHGGSEAGVENFYKVLESAMGGGVGSYAAAGQVRESLSTSDGPFNLAQLINVNFYPQFAEAERNWTEIAGERISPTLSKQGIYSLVFDWQDGVLGDGVPRHVAPRIAEGEAYPYAALGEIESKGNAFGKHGFKVKFTLEKQESDPLGFIAALPGLMLQVALDTEESNVYTALTQGVSTGQQLTAGTAPITGESVAANAPLSREALIVAIQQFKNRRMNGRRLQARGGFQLIVPVGQGDLAQWYISGLELSSVTDANFRYNAQLANPLASIVKVVESEYVEDGAWYLKAAGLANGLPVLEHLGWTKQRQPELRVADDAGNYLTGGKVPTTEGSFANDSINYRMRQFSGAALWVPDAVVWSTGEGA